MEVTFTEATSGKPRPAMSIERGGAPGAFPIDAVIGGERMEAYLTRFEDGAWVLLPLYYQVERHAFTDLTGITCGGELIGGRARASRWQSFDRVWNHRCQGCHVTAGVIGFDPATEEYASRWVEAGVGCEGCHGPGESHVEAASSGDGAGGIVNPARENPTGAAQICASCHALALPFESRWGGNRPYRPGDDFDAAFLPLLRPTESGPFSSLTHADRTPAVGVMEYQGLEQSRCALAGGLTCTSCHDPHGGSAARHQLRSPASGGALCAPCHEDVISRGEDHTHHAAGRPGGSCIDCHMPPTVAALGTRLASHAIDVPLPVNNVDYGVPDACSLCHADRGPGWAAQEFERLWGSPERHRRRKLARAFGESDVEGLRELLADHTESPLLRSDAVYALARVQRTRAAADLIRALRDDPSLVVRRVAADQLGSIGPVPGAPTEEKIRDQEALSRAGVNDALRRATEDGPAPQRLAAAASLARLETQDGLARLESLRADPQLDGGYRLHQLLGKYHLLRHHYAEAEAAFERVLEMTPNYLPVIKDLGFIYFVSNRFEEAHALWSRGRALDPEDEELQLSIHLAEDQMNAPDAEGKDGPAGQPGS